jgi:hypothetical protein
MAVEDHRGIAVDRLQRPQPLLIFQSPGAIYIGAALKHSEHQRHSWLHL